MDRTEFQPWTITGGTLQLNQWPAHTGRVVVTVDVFEPFEGPVVSHDGFDLMEYPPPWGSGEETTISDCLQALFAHIDANPQATYHLRTLHPERVREAWPKNTGCVCPGSSLAPGAECDHHPSCPARGYHRENVWLAAGPIRTQTEADRLLPELLQLSDLCREVYPVFRPVERIDLTSIQRKDGWRIDALRGVYEREHPPGIDHPGGVEGHDGGPQFPRIVVSGGPEPMHPDNVRCLRDQAAAAGVPFVFEGWGDWLPACQLPGDAEIYLADELMDRSDVSFARVGSEHSGDMLDGVRHEWESEVRA